MSENLEEFMKTREERVNYYQSQMNMINLVNIESGNHIEGIREIEQMLSEIIIEGCLEQREDGFKDKITFV